MSIVRLFIIESINPMDLLQGRTESQGLAEICKIIGHEVAIFSAYSKDDFQKLCKYISSISSEHDKNKRKGIPLCIHISAHGNEDGLAFGKDFIEWKEILKIMKPIFTDLEVAQYDGDIVIIISACGAGEQYLSKELQEEWKKNSLAFTPPKYIFVTRDEEVTWDDALVSWVIFYHQLPRINLNDKRSVQEVLDKIKISGVGNLQYFRWDEKKRKYLKYIGKS